MVSERDRFKLLATKTILNPGEDEELECFGYKRNTSKSIVAHLISILCVGIPYLIGYWKPEWQINWFRSICPLVQADTVLLKDKNEGQESAVVSIKRQKVTGDFLAQYIHKSDEEDLASDSSHSELNDRIPLWTPTKYSMRHFTYHHVKYVWNARQKTYTRLYGLDKNTSLHLFNSTLTQGLTRDELSLR